MAKKEKTDKVITGILLFGLLYIISVVYAFVSGTIIFQGETNFTNIVKLNIIDAQVTNGIVGDRATISFDAQTLTIQTRLDTPGEYRIVEFYIKNVGNRPTKLNTLVTEEPAPGSGLIITWPVLDDITFTIGETKGPYHIIVEWDNMVADPPPILSYKATIDYEQFTP